MKEKLQHAYDSFPLGKRRINVTIPEEEYNTLKTVRLQKGTIEFTLSHLIKKLVYELRTRNISSPLDANKFEDFLLTSRLLLPGESCPNFGHDHGGTSSPSVRGSAPSLPDGQTSAPNVGGGVGQLHPKDGGSPEGHSNPPSSPSSGSRGGSRTKGGKAKGAK